MGTRLNKAKSTLKRVFSMKVARMVGNFFSTVFKWLNISYKAAMWTFGILTLLLGIGLYSSIASLAALEGFIVIPLIGGLIKFVLFSGVLFGWVQFWIATKTVRKANDVVGKTSTALSVGKKSIDYGRKKVEQIREKHPIKKVEQKRKIRGSSKKHF